MLRKLFITPWFGPLPSWFHLYGPNIDRLKNQGFDWLPIYDLDEFYNRVRKKLGIECSIIPGGTKLHDYRSAFGELFEDEISGYDFWGHTDFDCVYGRLGHFVPDTLLADVDIYSDCCNDWKPYVCGPLALFRNTAEVRSIFRAHPEWRQILMNPKTIGWGETGYTQVVDASDLRVHYQEQHVWKPQDLVALHWDEERLMLRDEERSMAHFRRTKQYPAGLL